MTGRTARIRREDTAARTPRGYAGPGGGWVGYVESPTEYFGTSRQVCAFVAVRGRHRRNDHWGAIGTHLRTGAWMCGDPLSYFTRANLIRVPSALVFGQPCRRRSKSERLRRPKSERLRRPKSERVKAV